MLDFFFGFLFFFFSVHLIRVSFGFPLFYFCHFIFSLLSGFKPLVHASSSSSRHRHQQHGYDKPFSNPRPRLLTDHRNHRNWRQISLPLFFFLVVPKEHGLTPHRPLYFCPLLSSFNRLVYSPQFSKQKKKIIAIFKLPFPLSIHRSSSHRHV